MIGAVFGGAWILLQPWKDPSRSPFATPREVKLLWNKAPAIWFPWLGRASCKADHFRAAPGLRVSERAEAR
jgi:hypothetical protein